MPYDDNGNWIPGSEYDAPPTNPSPVDPGHGGGPTEAFIQQLRQWYAEYLGREPSEFDISQHWNNPEGLTGVRRAILASDEYKRRVASQNTPAPTPTPGGTGPNDTTPLPGNEGPYVGNLEGFDQGKLDDKTHQTIKYRAARVFRQFRPSDFVKDPTAVLNALKAAGLNPKLVGNDKIDFGDGFGPVDVIRAAGEGGKAWQWGVDDGTSASSTSTSTGTTATGTVPLSSVGGYGSLSSGFNESFSAPDWSGSGLVPGNYGGYAYSAPSYGTAAAGTAIPAPEAGYVDPTVYNGPGGQYGFWREGDPDWQRETETAPNGGAKTSVGFDWTVPVVADYVAPADYAAYVEPADFVAPTEADMLQDPSYRVRFDEGLKAAQAAKATQGLLRTGGTLKELTRYGQDQASKEYGNIYGRNFNTWSANVGKGLDAYNANRGTWQANADKGLGAWSANANLKAGQFDRGLEMTTTQDAIKYRDWLANYTNKRNEFMDRYKIWDDQQRRVFDQYYKLSSLGLTAAAS